MAKLDKLSGSKVRLEIEVTPEEFTHGLDHAFDKVKDDVEVKGFRKGKVPRDVYEKKYGVESLYDEALNHVVQETYINAVEEHQVEVVAQPKIDLDIAKVGPGKGFTYTAEVAVKPEVTLGEYKGLPFAKQMDTVTDAAVDAEMEQLLTQNAELVLKEEGTLEQGNTAVFDFEGFVDGEAFEGGSAKNHEMEIGSGQFIPGFEDQMIGMATGEEKEVNVSFPEQYQAENLAGKDAMFKVKLHEIKEKQTPELNDEFVKGLDKEGISTVEELRQETKEKLQNELVEKNRNARVDFAVEKATENAEMDIPQEMIVDEKNRLIDNVKQQAKQYNLELDMYLQLTGTNKEDFEANMLKQAEKSVSYNLVIEAVSKEEDIKATEEEVEQKFEEFAAQYNMPVDQFKAAVNPSAIEQEVIYRKTIDFLVDSLEITE
ncbi:MAG: trigger factor [Candidatus Izemoplasmataceae bacterium]